MVNSLNAWANSQPPYLKTDGDFGICYFLNEQNYRLFVTNYQCTAIEKKKQIISTFSNFILICCRFSVCFTVITQKLDCEDVE